MDLFENFYNRVEEEGQDQLGISVASLHGQAFDKLLMAWCIPAVVCMYADWCHVCLDASMIAL